MRNIKKQNIISTIIIGLLLSTVPLGTVGEEANLLGERELAMQPLNTNILYVGGDGLGNYTKIQDAINDASNGDMVFVYDDSSPYIEQLIVDKSIKIVGENRDSTIIDGDDIGDVVVISADKVNISGFTIQNSGGIKSGVEISYSDDVNIVNNIFTLSKEQCIRLSSTHNNYITGNSFISNQGRGILLDSSSNNIIVANDFSANDNDGVAVLYSSSNNNISSNTIVNSEGGIWLDGPGSYNTISNNLIVDNSAFGIWSCTSTNNNTIKGNYIAETNYGIILNNTRDNIIQGNDVNNVTNAIHLCYARYCNIFENSISHNEIGIECCVSSDYNIFFHNNFYNNSESALDDSNNSWDNGYPSGGNYWDDYNGTDNDGDGIGDTPYLIPCGNNQDNYPFMELNGWINYLPNKPIIVGPTKGAAGTSYDYTFSATDPDNSIIYLYVDWGDKTNTGWLGPYNSGQQVTLSHSWFEQDTYIIKAKAQDNYGSESDWGTLEVIMPKNKAFNFNLLSWLLERFPILQKLLILMY